MTAAQLIKNIYALLITDHKEDFKEACTIFNTIEDQDVFNKVYDRFPHLLNYDANGNFVGSYHNENGWLA